MIAPTWVGKTLDRHGIPYQELRHPPAFTAQDVARVEHVSGHRVAKVVVVVADGRLVELVLPASRRVDLRQVRDLLGAREARLASEAEVARAFPGTEPGATPALRQWPGVPVLMDSSLFVGGDILLQAGTHHDAVRLRFTDWYTLVGPSVESFTEPAEAGQRRAPSAGHPW
jgi:Ala-tRNA(Pro) deacylase